MHSSVRNNEPLAQHVFCTDDQLVVALTDGRTLSVPLTWFPRLANATPEQKAHYELLGNGSGIHWPMVDEDLSVAGLLVGRSSIR